MPRQAPALPSGPTARSRQARTTVSGRWRGGGGCAACRVGRRPPCRCPRGRRPRRVRRRLAGRVGGRLPRRPRRPGARALGHRTRRWGGLRATTASAPPPPALVPPRVGFPTSASRHAAHLSEEAVEDRDPAPVDGGDPAPDVEVCRVDAVDHRERPLRLVPVHDVEDRRENQQDHEELDEAAWGQHGGVEMRGGKPLQARASGVDGGDARPLSPAAAAASGTAREWPRGSVSRTRSLSSRTLFSCFRNSSFCALGSKLGLQGIVWMRNLSLVTPCAMPSISLARSDICGEGAGGAPGPPRALRTRDRPRAATSRPSKVRDRRRVRGERGNEAARGEEGIPSASARTLARPLAPPRPRAMSRSRRARAPAGRSGRGNRARKQTVRPPATRREPRAREEPADGLCEDLRTQRARVPPARGPERGPPGRSPRPSAHLDVDRLLGLDNAA